MEAIIYSKRKLKPAEKMQLEQALDGLSFSCGAQLQDADIPEHLKDTVFIRQLSCEEPIEKLYYSTNIYVPTVLLQLLPGMTRNSTIPSVRVVEKSHHF